ncbi:histidine phosphatase family protein [Nocardioides cavernaquae]|uniref:Histidine phosphatase family protein n=1 Tax=Nocardioides cavernaquae TaxID=2321396 RepID=A0A3A5H8D4_9ACTN|nr:histidine phosphatase family protein [Nocardioides cavernaquae]RJS46118.1 histidine phosphatase family protein [Nocardioides cavernaquae]
MTTPEKNQPEKTTVHLMRHGEVHNPEGVLYGRRPGYYLSERGKLMAETVADAIKHRDITHLRVSPLERAQETAAPLAKARGLEIVTDDRVIESENWFEGKQFGKGDHPLKDPRSWLKLYNPLKPSWGEPYSVISARMMAAVEDAREVARGHEAVIVSHQLPIWTTRMFVEKRSMLHDPRKRQCTLCSLTSLNFTGDQLTSVTYSEPAGHLIPAGDKNAPFSAGDAPQEHRP